MNNDWDLHAVVKGYCSSTITSPTTITNTTNFHTLSYLNSSHLSYTFNKYDNFFGITEDPFEELYRAVKPFLPKCNQPKPPQISPVSSSITTTQERKKQPKVASLTATISNGGVSTTYQPPKSKRRYNMHKKVCHVREDILYSDIITWRKYGQKHIKSSPYPRCYYKCNSSKECLARKQVQRNKSDPKMFTVTYTSEHNHTDPADHQNFLADYTRAKRNATPLAAPAIVSSSIDGHAKVVTNQGVPCGSSGEGELVMKIDQSNILEDRIEDQLGQDVFDMDMSDDFFEGLDDFIASDAGYGFSD